MVFKKKPLKEKATKTFSRQPSETKSETKETQFWTEVEEHSKNLIANLIEKILPISAIPAVFDLEKDADYRILLRIDLPRNYEDNEEYLNRIESGNWNEDDVEQVSQELTVAYWEIVVKSLVDWLSDYPGFESTSLSSLEGLNE